jgi:RNA polymerase sigma factor (sigma-70 family)
MGARPQWEFDPDIAELIRMKVIKFGFARGERDDVAQDLSLHVVISMKRYDPTRASRRTFVNHVVTNKIKSILEHRNGEKRDRRRLSEANIDETDVPDDQHRSGDMDLQIDVRDAVSHLPPELCAIATLFETFSEAEVIERSGLSRQQVRGRRQKIARHLQACGIEPYFRKSATNPPATSVHDYIGANEAPKRNNS